MCVYRWIFKTILVGSFEVYICAFLCPQECVFCFSNKGGGAETPQDQGCPSSVSSPPPLLGNCLAAQSSLFLVACLNCKCKWVPAQATSVLPKPSRMTLFQPSWGHYTLRGLQGWRVPSATFSGLTVRRFLLKSNCDQSCCSGGPFPQILSSVERENRC